MLNGGRPNCGPKFWFGYCWGYCGYCCGNCCGNGCCGKIPGNWPDACGPNGGRPPILVLPNPGGPPNNGFTAPNGEKLLFGTPKPLPFVLTFDAPAPAVAPVFPFSEEACDDADDVPDVKLNSPKFCVCDVDCDCELVRAPKPVAVAPAVDPDCAPAKPGLPPLNSPLLPSAKFKPPKFTPKPWPFCGRFKPKPPLPGLLLRPAEMPKPPMLKFSCKPALYAPDDDDAFEPDTVLEMGKPAKLIELVRALLCAELCEPPLIPRDCACDNVLSTPIKLPTFSPLDTLLADALADDPLPATGWNAA